MAINAYTGLMGSGKSFEVTCSVILPAIKNGRRVVTNIDGINEALIHEYLVKKGADRDKLGTIVTCTNEDVMKPGFFPDEEVDIVKTAPDERNRPVVVERVATGLMKPSLVQPGDMVCLDEAWRFWASGTKLPEEHMQFVRMHRHYVHPETGVACDLALMIQDIGDLHRSIKAVVEMTSRCIKLKKLGLNSGYRIELYEGYKLVKKAQIDYMVKKYDKAIFPLYKSYAGAGGKEKAIDKRQNIFTNSRLWLFLALMVVVSCVAFYYLWWFFYGRRADMLNAAHPNQPVAAAPGVPGAPAGAAASPGAVPRAPESTYRIAGEVQINGDHYIVVMDGSGRIRFENPSAFVGRGSLLVGTVEGQRVTPSTGLASPGVKK